MSTFSRRAKAEAAKYQHQIHPKHRHKYNFGSDCGAGEQDNKGFQPGNTCGGDGDGKNDAGDQGGGDKSKAQTKEMKAATTELRDNAQMFLDMADPDEVDRIDVLIAKQNHNQLTSLADAIDKGDAKSAFELYSELEAGLEDEVPDALQKYLGDVEENLIMDEMDADGDKYDDATKVLDRATGLGVLDEDTLIKYEEMIDDGDYEKATRELDDLMAEYEETSAPAAGSTVYDQVKDFMDTNPTEAEIESFYINEIQPQDKRSMNEILQEDDPRDYETRKQEIDDKLDSGEISANDAHYLIEDLDAAMGMGEYAPSTGDPELDELAALEAEDDATAEERAAIEDEEAATAATADSDLEKIDWVPNRGFDDMGEMPMSSIAEKAAKDYKIPKNASGQEAYEIITSQGGHHELMEDFYGEEYVDNLDSETEDNDEYSDHLDEFEAELIAVLDHVYGEPTQYGDEADAPAADSGKWKPGQPLDRATSVKVQKAAEQLAKDFPEYTVEQHRQMMTDAMTTPERDLPFTEGAAEELAQSFGLAGEPRGIERMMEMVENSVDYNEASPEMQALADELIKDGHILRYVYDETGINPRDLDNRWDELGMG